jgi:hypothetical protein
MGAPNTDMIPSPWNETSVPPLSSTASPISLNQRSRTSITSPSSRSARVVNPRRSQNSTVASTRSPGEARRGVGAREQLTHHLLGHEALEGRADAAAGADLDRVRQRDGAGGAEHERE